MEVEISLRLEANKTLAKKAVDSSLVTEPAPH